MRAVESDSDLVLTTGCVAEVSRRLFGISVIGALGYGLGKGGEQLVQRYFPPLPQPEDVTPYAIAGPELMIQKGVNIRTSPQIPDSTRFWRPTNIIPWENIKDVNGEILTGDVFGIHNAWVVPGRIPRGPDPYYRPDPEVYSLPRISDTLDSWVKISVLEKDSGKRRAGYISRGFRTLTLYENYFIEPGVRSTIENEAQNLVYVPSDPTRLAREMVPPFWRVRAARKLDGQEPLWRYSDQRFRQNERIIPVAQIVPSGASWSERQKMIDEGGLVKVRNYPAQFYGNREPVEVFGEIKLGTLLNDALDSVYTGWVALRRKNIMGDIYDSERNVINNVNPNLILAIGDDYVEVVK